MQMTAVPPAAPVRARRLPLPALRMPLPQRTLSAPTAACTTVAEAVSAPAAAQPSPKAQSSASAAARQAMVARSAPGCGDPMDSTGAAAHAAPEPQLQGTGPQLARHDGVVFSSGFCARRENMGKVAEIETRAGRLFGERLCEPVSTPGPAGSDSGQNRGIDRADAEARAELLGADAADMPWCQLLLGMSLEKTSIAVGTQLSMTATGVVAYMLVETAALAAISMHLSCSGGTMQPVRSISSVPGAKRDADVDGRACAGHLVWEPGLTSCDLVPWLVRP